MAKRGRAGGYSLEREVARGAEGVIYTIRGRDELVAKVYQPAPRPEYEAKLRWMQANPPTAAAGRSGHISIAWPQGLVRRENRFIGYVMPYVRRAVPLLEVFNPRLRAARLPGFDLRYLYRTARNIATALESIHTSGYLIGDVNESNILVTPQALVVVIDTDSFQVKAGRKLYACPVGKPEYTAPELVGKSYAGLERKAAQDNFGLGILIFQLLMEGNHPFRSLWLKGGEPPPIEEKIRRGWFPYGRPGRGPVRPPPGVPPLATLHPEVARLMRRCFIGGHGRPGKRPGPRDWARALGEAEKKLAACTEGHVYSAHLRRCPRCHPGALSHPRPRWTLAWRAGRPKAWIKAPPKAAAKGPKERQRKGPKDQSKGRHSGLRIGWRRPAVVLLAGLLAGGLWSLWRTWEGARVEVVQAPSPDETAFKAAVALGTAMALEGFVERFPDSPYATRAGQGIVEYGTYEKARGAGDAPALARFVAQYPFSRFAEEAQRQILQIRARRARAVLAELERRTRGE